jgi:hypothetical protein
MEVSALAIHMLPRLNIAPVKYSMRTGTENSTGGEQSMDVLKRMVPHNVHTPPAKMDMRNKRSTNASLAWKAVLLVSVTAPPNNSTQGEWSRYFLTPTQH